MSRPARTSRAYPSIPDAGPRGRNAIPCLAALLILASALTPLAGAQSQGAVDGTTSRFEILRYEGEYPVPAGEAGTYVVQFTNEADVAAEVAFHAEATESDRFSVTLEPPRLVLDPGVSGTVTVWYRAPHGDPGAMEFSGRVEATASTETETLSLPWTFAVRGRDTSGNSGPGPAAMTPQPKGPGGPFDAYGARITTSTNRLDLAPGQTGTVEIRVENLNADRLDLRFESAGRMGTTYAPDALTVEPGATGTVTATVTMPEELPPDAQVGELVAAELVDVIRVSGGTTMNGDRYPIPVAGLVLAAQNNAGPMQVPGATPPLAILAVGAAAAIATLIAGIGLARESSRYRFLSLLAALPLFTRLKKSDALNHESRRRLHALIRETPGIRYAELKKATGLNTGTIVHHLRTLERQGLVVSRRDGSFRRFHPAGAAWTEAHPEASAADAADPYGPAPPGHRAPGAPGITPAQARVLQLLDGGPLSQSEIAARLGVSQQAANAHVKTLERRGWVTFENGSRGRILCRRVVGPNPGPDVASRERAARMTLDRSIATFSRVDDDTTGPR